MKIRTLLGTGFALSLSLFLFDVTTPAVAADVVSSAQPMAQQTATTVTYGGESIVVVPFARITVTYTTSTGRIIDTITFTNYDSQEEKTFVTPIKTITLDQVDQPLVVIMESVL
ncbi:hypothetical protein P4377_26420 [Bacillus thuringiensis]|nr:hypothetical protein [Bacillus thuringiensis]